MTLLWIADAVAIAILIGAIATASSARAVLLMRSDDSERLLKWAQWALTALLVAALWAFAIHMGAFE